MVANESPTHLRRGTAAGARDKSHASACSGGWEAQGGRAAHAPVHAGTPRADLVGALRLGHRRTLEQSPFQPRKVRDDRGGVQAASPLEATSLDLVLLRLEELDRARVDEHALLRLNPRGHRQRRRRTLEHHSRLLVIAAGEACRRRSVEARVGLERHGGLLATVAALCHEVRLHRLFGGRVLDVVVQRAQEERHIHGSASHTDTRVCKEDGIADDVRAAQVEQPADLIERVEHQAVAALLLERLGYAHQLARDRLARKRRAPKVVAALAAPLLYRRERDEGRVDAHAQLRIPRPLLQVGHAGLVHLHQLEACAFELLGGLRKVTPVGPEQRLLGGNHGRPRAAREAGEPLYALVRVRDVL
eukprot:5644679-Prymnesium_polylepis.2